MVRQRFERGHLRITLGVQPRRTVYHSKQQSPYPFKYLSSLPISWLEILSIATAIRFYESPQKRRWDCIIRMRLQVYLTKKARQNRTRFLSSRRRRRRHAILLVAVTTAGKAMQNAAIRGVQDSWRALCWVGMRMA